MAYRFSLWRNDFRNALAVQECSQSRLDETGNLHVCKTHRVLSAAGFCSREPLKVVPLEFQLNRQATTDAEGRFELGPLYDARYALAADEDALALQASRWGVPALRVEAPEFEVRHGQVGEVDARLLVD